MYVLHISIYPYISARVCICVRVCVLVYVLMYVCMCVCMHVRIYAYACMCLCLCKCVTRVYVYVYLNSSAGMFYVGARRFAQKHHPPILVYVSQQKLSICHSWPLRMMGTTALEQ